jgi:hypothetical protein
VEEETCFFRDGKRGIGNSLLIVELARLPPFVTVKLSPFISLQIEKKIISFNICSLTNTIYFPLVAITI